MAPAIRVEGLSKRYRITHGEDRAPYRTLREELVRAALRPMRQLFGGPTGATTEDFWALKDVSFEVQPGEVVGIIGRNGAGKSTLLKILSRIVRPTAGRVRLRGRIGSLLEVGTGFHPELTGRENIYLSGAILGMRRAEIRQKFDGIVAFAEVEKFLDTPVKRYSSGMYVRLAFAVAAFLEPEILLVDEVLAVGDAAFQKKCLGRMADVARGGRTILFVSHNMAAISSLCQRALLFSGGRLLTSGPVHDVVQRYLKDGNTEGRRRKQINCRQRMGSGLAHIAEIAMFDAEGVETPVLRTGDKCSLGFRYRCTSLIGRVDFAFGLLDSVGTYCMHCSTNTIGLTLTLPQQDGWIVCTFNKLPLVPGTYYLNYMLQAVGGDILDYVQNAQSIEVSLGDFYGTGRLPHPTLGSVLAEYTYEARPLDVAP